LIYGLGGRRGRSAGVAIARKGAAAVVRAGNRIGTGGVVGGGVRVGQEGVVEGSVEVVAAIAAKATQKPSAGGRKTVSARDTGQTDL
jgi:hypothetical protein